MIYTYMRDRSPDITAARMQMAQKYRIMRMESPALARLTFQRAQAARESAIKELYGQGTVPPGTKIKGLAALSSSTT
jgi:hypothetical protein